MRSPKLLKTKLKAAQPKLSPSESQELKTLPDKIDALEKEQAQLTASLADSELYRSDPQAALGLQARFTEIEKTLLKNLARWEDLEAKQKSLAG